MFKIQFDAKGRFRIRAYDGAVILAEGEWASYQSVATLEYGGETFIAGSAFGLLPEAETVYCLSRDGIETGELDHSFENIDSATGKVYSSVG
jgi:hypothetical protein